MDEDVKEIGAYEARIHWGRILDEVSAGAVRVISKRHESVAALVPLALWQQSRGGADDVDARELDAVLRQLHERHDQTMAALDEAFSELARTRQELIALRAEREQGQQKETSHARGA
jgi:antitoxin (DNA-binding transcriptional repressor) of toxin-antitoxin stability system